MVQLNVRAAAEVLHLGLVILVLLVREAQAALVMGHVSEAGGGGGWIGGAGGDAMYGGSPIARYMAGGGGGGAGLLGTGVIGNEISNDTVGNGKIIVTIKK